MQATAHQADRHTRIVPENKLELAQSLDLPDVLLHLTYRRGRASPGVEPEIASMDPWDRVANLLLYRTLRFGRPFDTTWPVASFMQTTPRALFGLHLFQPTGLAFHKQAVWDAGGGPVHYVRGDHWPAWRGSNLPDQVKSMGVRLSPGSNETAEGGFFSVQPRARSEWMHEREWRLPCPDLTMWGWSFPWEAVAFLVFPGPEVRDHMLTTLSKWGGDRGWAERLPVAYPDATTRTFHGAGSIWA